MSKSAIDDIRVPVTLSFEEWDKIKSALWAAGPRLQDLHNKIGSAQVEAYDLWRRDCKNG